MEEIRKRLEGIKAELPTIRKQTEIARRRYRKLFNYQQELLNEYEKLDLKLAKLDGRFKVVEPKNAKGRKTKELQVVDVMAVLRSLSPEDKAGILKALE